MFDGVGPEIGKCSLNQSSFALNEFAHNRLIRLTRATHNSFLTLSAGSSLTLFFHQIDELAYVSHVFRRLSFYFDSRIPLD